MAKLAAKRILVCTVPEMLELVQSSLGRIYTCDYCRTIQQACDAFEKKPDLVLCNVQFDESRMFDILAYVRNHPRGMDVPIVISHTKDSMTPALLKSIEAASRAIGIQAFIDGPWWVGQYGMRAAKKNLVDTVSGLLEPAKAPSTEGQTSLRPACTDPGATS